MDIAQYCIGLYNSCMDILRTYIEGVREGEGRWGGKVGKRGGGEEAGERKCKEAYSSESL